MWKFLPNCPSIMRAVGFRQVRSKSHIRTSTASKFRHWKSWPTRRTTAPILAIMSTSKKNFGDLYVFSNGADDLEKPPRVRLSFDKKCEEKEGDLFQGYFCRRIPGETNHLPKWTESIEFNTDRFLWILSLAVPSPTITYCRCRIVLIFIFNMKYLLRRTNDPKYCAIDAAV